MKARILIEVIIVLVLGFVAYTKFIKPKPEVPPDITQTALNKEQSTRLNKLIKKSKTTKPKVKAHTPNPTDFKPEATSVQQEPEPIPVEIETTLTGQVVDENGQAILDSVTVYSTSCRFTGIALNGRFNLIVEPGVCLVSAQRTVGDHILEANPIQVDLKAGQANEITLVMPAEMVGTVGIDLILHDAYAEVSAVEPGSPASEIGMEPGHVIVEINGRKVAGLSQDDILASLTGRVGEEVRMLIVVEADGNLQEIPVALSRVVLP